MGCAHWPTAGELARISLIGRERHQGLVLTRTCAMVPVEEAKADVVGVVVVIKILTIKITLQRMNIQFPLDEGRDPN